MKNEKALVWFRRDLRDHDHAALGAALAWSGLGALTGSRANPGGLRLIQRGAALWLGLVAASLAFGGVPG